MSKYSEIAILAAESAGQKKISPKDAWKSAAKRVFLKSQTSRDKSCPQSTFLGLCSEGKVVGVKKGQYTKSKKNKKYAIYAMSELSKNSELVDNPNILWKKVLTICKEDISKAQNSQMEVVIALWNNNLIK